MKKKIALYGILTSLCLLTGFIETLIPLPVAIPGIKLGLGNIVVLYILYTMGEKDAACISAAKVVLSGFIFGNMAGILYSLCGAALSLFVMIMLKRTKKFSVIGVSVSGGASHNTGQIIAAVIITSWSTVRFYIPFLIISGIITGIIIGILEREIMKRVPYKAE